ncbi:MAG: glycosyltransferase family 9 protein [Opitutales bacterium]|nr:glycosyltransferase family 9 protein [Opitutales bacterium]
MRLLVIKPSSLGDIVHAMVVVSELKRQRPKVVVDWVARDCFAELVRASQIAQRVLIYERRGGLLSFFRLLSLIRQETYDCVFDMQGLARSGIMTLFARSPRKIGRKDARELSCLAYTETVPYPGAVHAIDILKEFLTTVDCSNEVSGIVTEFEHVTSPKYTEFLKEQIPQKPFICLFPESRVPEKEWRHFSKLAELLLISEPNINLLILGSPSHLRFHCENPRLFDFRGQTSLTDAVFLIRNASLVIANDSGPMHISAAQGRPTLGLFTITDPLRFGPYPVYRKSNVALRLENKAYEAELVAHTAVEMLNDFAWNDRNFSL